MKNKSAIYQPQKVNNLTVILNQLIYRADLKPRVKADCHLKRGLIIEVTLEGAAYLLVLRRKDTQPSDAEWQAVLDAWPWPVQVRAERSQMSRPPYLFGRIGPRIGQGVARA